VQNPTGPPWSKKSSIRAKEWTLISLAPDKISRKQSLMDNRHPELI
jgi:hypothetical protein